MPGSIQASTAPVCPLVDETVRSTCAEMIERRVPNLFRLYLNPCVAQACYCLAGLVEETCRNASKGDPYQVFLANSMEEALSGAVKLARYVGNAQGGASWGIAVDPADRLRHFASTPVESGKRIDYVPSLDVVAGLDEALEGVQRQTGSLGFLVVFGDVLQTHREELRGVLDACSSRGTRPRLIVCADCDSLAGAAPGGVVPDIVVFDDSFTDGQVPFGAFAAPRSLLRYWSKRGMTTFHSTTYQPNTISTLHLLHCLRRARPDFMERHAATLARIARDFDFRRRVFAERYSRSLARLIRTVGWHETEVKTAGHYVEIAGRRIFDGVGGVACSIRGHSPPSYLTDVEQLGDIQACREELSARLLELTGLPHVTPAVSGASAVEHALKLGLASQYPRDHVLVMRGGFGGKTLFALTGTWKASLRRGIDPLYPHVVYVDPFATDAVTAVEAAFQRYPIGVVQCELIQGVGGVRALPSEVLECLARMRKRHDCLLFVDEVQTGVYRTGEFVRSRQLDLQPDLLTIGKAASDMMFPYSLTLHSEAIEERLAAHHCDLPSILRCRYDYELGLRTLLNVLRYAEQHKLSATVRERGEQFQRVLSARLRGCKNVRDVRSFGLLIGIELAAGAGPRRWLGRVRQQLFLLAMLKHPHMPLLVGYCQYEPHVLKFTPPLSTTEEEVESICETISSVLHLPLARAARSALWPKSAKQETLT
ncbi:MAG TPA: aminotransferase class III-fold pyridoxal phosphate-dependent enzyme [Pirellulales bacterium]|nr:aminotransferase class III-fold pyridoxal phosphate-dependent enzyme [Pirellulales bacterium]